MEIGSQIKLSFERMMKLKLTTAQRMMKHLDENAAEYYAPIIKRTKEVLALEQSLKEMNQIREGEIEPKTWDQFFAEILTEESDN